MTLADNQPKCPTVSKALVEYLAEVFPDRCANLTWSDREIWYKSGQRSVITFLIQHHNDQNNVRTEDA